MQDLVLKFPTNKLSSLHSTSTYLFLIYSSLSSFTNQQKNKIILLPIHKKMNLTTSLSFFPLFFFLLISSSFAFNITNILSQYSDFTTFNNLLTQTGLADQINYRTKVTILAVDNAAIGPASIQSLNLLKNVFSLHVVSGYYDVQKLQHLPAKSRLLRTLFQSNEQLGFLNANVSQTGRVTVSSAASQSGADINVLKSVTAEPYNVSVLQIGGLIVPQVIRYSILNFESSPSPSHSVSSPPPPAPPAKTPAPLPPSPSLPPSPPGNTTSPLPPSPSTPPSPPATTPSLPPPSPPSPPSPPLSPPPSNPPAHTPAPEAHRSAPPTNSSAPHWIALSPSGSPAPWSNNSSSPSRSPASLPSGDGAPTSDIPLPATPAPDFTPLAGPVPVAAAGILNFNVGVVTTLVLFCMSSFGLFNR